MKQLLKVIGVGIAIWLLSLLWLDINRILLWSLFIGVITGMMPAYLFGRLLAGLHGSATPRPVRPYSRPTRPTAVRAAPDSSARPTRPSQVMSPRERASCPTRPMPAL